MTYPITGRCNERNPNLIEVPYPKTRFGRVFLHIYQGLHYGIPVCCVLRFAFSRQNMQAVVRGSRFHAGEYGNGMRCYVPCLWIHRPHERVVDKSEDGGYIWERC